MPIIEITVPPDYEYEGFITTDLERPAQQAGVAAQIPGLEAEHEFISCVHVGSPGLKSVLIHVSLLQKPERTNEILQRLAHELARRISAACRGCGIRHESVIVMTHQQNPEAGFCEITVE